MTRIVPPPPPQWKTWECLMQVALEEATLARQANEVPVGAVVVSPHGDLLGRGHNVVESLQDPLAHAEVVAIQNACQSTGNYRLDGCLLLTTLEPCLMCSGAIVHARIKGVVFGAYDTKAGAIASCTDSFDLPFLNHRPWHLGGILENECKALLTDFFKSVR